jgi:hypothetical protein
MKSSVAYLSIITLGMVGGCASTPDVDITYWFPVATTAISATQTIGCNPTGDVIYAMTNVTAAPTYAADRASGATWGTIHYKAFGGPLSDADVTVNRKSDGRLDGLNSVSTGQADTVIKNIATLAATAGGAGFFSKIDSFLQDNGKNPLQGLNAGKTLSA